MNYASQHMLNKKLPSFVGFIVLALSLVTIGWLSRNAILFGTKAAVDNTPKNVKISNISDTSFSVSYTTDSSVVGSIRYGQGDTAEQIALDDRDQEGSEYTVHHITLKGLTPATKYSFVITSGDQNFSNENQPYEVTTAPAGTNTNNSPLQLNGKVTRDDGTAPAEAIAYVTTTNSQLLSTLVDTNGNYKITVPAIRSKNLSSFINLTPASMLQIELITATEKSLISLLNSQADPVPLVILTKNYDFAVSDLPLSPTASESAYVSITPPTFPTIEGAENDAPQILNPKDEQTLKDQQPLFRGIAQPNETVTITINSEHTITATVKADANGNWQFRPDEPLEPGTHTISIRTIDAQGLVRVITQSFVVYAEGSQFVEPSVSPSASITTSHTPTPTRKPSATNTPKPTNTTTPSPTKTTASPSLQPTATRTPTPSQTKTTTTISASATRPPIPVTGNTSLILTIIGFVAAVAIGALLFFLTAV